MAFARARQTLTLPGTVEGVLRAIDDAGDLSFTLEYRRTDSDLRCRADESYAVELREKLDSLLGKSIVVTGEITRDVKTGQPLEVLDVSRVEPVASAGDYKQARGTLAHLGWDEPAEIGTRRLRDLDE